MAAAASAAAQPKPGAPLRVQWSDVKATEGCFFFSGPAGRDDRLVGSARITRDPSGVIVTIAKAEFRGVVRDQRLVATRTSKHDFGGAWIVTETLRGRYSDGAFVGSYSYEECEVGKQKGVEAETCPDRCRIAATLALRP